jgi:Rrf2 family cysteine metabolism transcriptional repressor
VSATEAQPGLVPLAARTRHGLAALVEIAANEPGPTPLRQVARERGLSLASLERIASDLRRAGLVHAVRGTRGGYRLARPADQITALDVVRALQVPGDGFFLRDDPNDLLWLRVESAVERVLREVKVADLVAQRDQVEGEPMYYI